MSVSWMFCSTGLWFNFLISKSTGFQDLQSGISVTVLQLGIDAISQQDSFNQVYDMTECGL